ncbi:MAG: L-threonylcarbamoyladenylate synthase [Candidatus Spechtbacterales bacterium]
MGNASCISKNEPASVGQTVQYLQRGFAVVLPTDTLYGLAVDALNERAVERFFKLKQRPATKPVPLFVRDIAMAKEMAFIDRRQEAMLEKLWPGPFTFVLFKRNKVSLRLTGTTQKVGLRIPDDTFCQAVLDEFGGPITASSANISGKEAPTTVEEIMAQFKEHGTAPDLCVDAGPLEGRQPSTVIDISGPRAVIVRMSAASPAQLATILKAGESL